MTKFLIERMIHGRAVWYSVSASPCRDWTTDALIAVHYDSKSEAWVALGKLQKRDHEWRHASVTEHVFA